MSFSIEVVYWIRSSKIILNFEQELNQQKDALELNVKNV